LAHPRPLRQGLQSTTATQDDTRDSLKASDTFRTRGVVYRLQIKLRSGERVQHPRSDLCWCIGTIMESFFLIQAFGGNAQCWEKLVTKWEHHYPYN
jgi:hypothetical protein